jgi:hypothetical protein
MIIPPTSPNRIMCRHRRAFRLLTGRSALVPSVPGEVAGELAVDGITQRYTTEQSDRAELCWCTAGRGADGAGNVNGEESSLTLRGGFGMTACE